MEVPSLEQFNELLKRVEELEERERRRDQHPLALEWVTSDQARKMLGNKTRPICWQKLVNMAKMGLIERKAFGRRIMYNLESIRTFLNGTYIRPCQKTEL